MSIPLTHPQAVPPVVPRPASRRVIFLVAGAGLLLTFAGALLMAADIPRQTVLRPLTRQGGWQRAMVAEGGRDVALRAEAAAWRSGAPAALADGATILASLSGATGDEEIARDLHQRSLALAVSALHQAPAIAQTHFIAGAVSASLDSSSPITSRYLARSASLDPHGASLRGRIGMVELDRGRLGEAATHFRIALAADPRMARPLYEALAGLGADLDEVQVTPETPRAQVALGSWLYENDDLAGSERAFKTSLRATETDGSREESLWAYRNLYSYLTRQHRFAEAKELAAVRLAAGVYHESDEHALLLYHEGVALLRMKLQEDAIPYLAEATTLQPEVLRYLDTYAAALAAAGYPADAARIWQRALSLPRQTENERNQEIHMRLSRARSLKLAGQPSSALAELRLVLMSHPDHPQARQLAAELAYE